MSTLTQTQGLTTHEMLILNELIRLESGDVQKTKSMLAMVSDPDLRQQLTACLQTGQAHGAGPARLLPDPGNWRQEGRTVRR